MAKKKVAKKTEAATMVEDLESASRLLSVAMSKAERMDFAKTNPRAFQQINNARVRVDAALDEIAE